MVIEMKPKIPRVIDNNSLHKIKLSKIMSVLTVSFKSYLLVFLCLCFVFSAVLLQLSFGANARWLADHETGDLSQWTQDGPYGSRGGSFDSGDCTRPPKGVTAEQAFSGSYSMKMSIGPGGGCRQFRHAESTSGKAFYYSAWLYFPKLYSIGSWSNIFQFKSETSSQNDAVWVLELRNRSNGAMYLMLRWKGIMAGPTEGEGTGLKHFHQTLKDVWVGKWFHVEVYLKQASDYTGRITVWQDGVQIYDKNNVKTKYPGGDNRWSLNAYGGGISPLPFTVYVDDAVVSTSRIGPAENPDRNPPSAPSRLRITN
ncbi:MAG: heparin lyase I family protein [bacterium]